jgi:transcriptional regulator with PAS, ATPase and Fis domain
VGLFSHFLREHSGGLEPNIEPRLVERLLLYDWPFNVRELELLARHLLVLYGHEPALRPSYLPERVNNGRRTDNGRAESTSVSTLREADKPQETLSVPDRNERDLIALVAALREHGGNVARAAAAIDISRQRAYRLMEGRPGLDLEAFRGPSGAPKRERKS